MATHTMEQFTQRARRVLSFAQEEAERMRHSYIGTEHMLIGLMREEGGVAGRVLHDLGVDQRRVEELVDRLTYTQQRSPSKQLVLSADIKKVLELAVDEARRMGHHYIGTEHLLLGLVRQSEGIAIDVLRRLSVKPEEVRRQTRRVLQENPAQPLRPPQVKTPSIGELMADTIPLALHEAAHRGHRFAGPWHILLAILHREGAAQRILRELGINEQRLEEVVGKSAQTVTIAQLASSGSGALGYACDVALQLHEDIVRDEHLLFALATYNEDMFELLNLDRERLRSELEKHFNREL
jgi:ATP-dependent Clp protease ATP-binding subunit ClpA